MTKRGSGGMMWMSKTMWIMFDWRECECVMACVCPDGVGLTCRAYPGGPLLGSDSTGGCTPARPAARTSSAADSARTLLQPQTPKNLITLDIFPY